MTVQITRKIKGELTKDGAPNATGTFAAIAQAATNVRLPAGGYTGEQPVVSRWPAPPSVTL